MTREAWEARAAAGGGPPPYGDGAPQPQDRHALRWDFHYPRRRWAHPSGKLRCDRAAGCSGRPCGRCYMDCGRQSGRSPGQPLWLPRWGNALVAQRRRV